MGFDINKYISPFQPSLKATFPFSLPAQNQDELPEQMQRNCPNTDEPVSTVWTCFGFVCDRTEARKSIKDQMNASEDFPEGLDHKSKEVGLFGFGVGFF